MTKIVQLPDYLIRQIAAGEVIAEPISVIKEAIENSLDAGASDIQIDIKNGGISSIIIADNGIGIAKEDLEVITTRHSTSKIKTEEDLVHVLTLGFRGEFLASLVAAADLIIITKEKDENIAYRAAYNVGSAPTIESTSRTTGTTLMVTNLFEKLPARRNFLPKPKTSTARIHEVVRQFALAYSKVRFSLRADDKELFRSQPGEKLNAITMVLGSKTGKNLIHIAGESEDKVWKLEGYISKPVEVRATRSNEYFFVNGRIIENTLLQKALEDGYSNFLAPRKFPLAVLYFTAPPDAFDANVHPAKKEIRIKSEKAVYQFVSELVYAALTHTPGTNEILSEPTKPLTQQSFARQLPAKKPETTRTKILPTTASTLNQPRPVATERTARQSVEASTQVDDFEREDQSEQDEDKHPLQDELQHFYDRMDITQIGNNYFIHVIHKEELKDLEPIIQIKNTFIIASNSHYTENLYFIDQHAVAERITLEKMLFAKKKIIKQTLLEPLAMQVTPEEYDLVEEMIPLMKKYGYSLKQEPGLNISIQAVPSYQRKKLSREQILFNLREILAENLKNKGSISNVSNMEQEVLKSIACHNSIRAGDVLTHQEMKELLASMNEAKFPYVCCHGRPAIFKLPMKMLLKLFWRT